MRFRGQLTAASFPILMEVSQFMHRVSSSDTCFVMLNEERMSFAMKTSGEDMQTFVHLSVAKLFADVVVESRADNNIAFALGIANFSRALQSGKDASGVMLRLLKRDGRSFLSLRARTVDLDIIQNIPIEVVSMATAENYREPNIPPPTVALEMPPLRAFRTITDRLKTMQKYLLVRTIPPRHHCLMHIMHIDPSWDGRHPSTSRAKRYVCVADIAHELALSTRFGRASKQ
ncbi:hypothetical protein, variant [Aphanomyces astaci]|uniref:Checkpoint protein n=1 Tax=Aphanomyces astaci TaxID=112090 RepID=W4GXW2_APHAT|nr:hypothetical protein, variant [Aphanomyces astaci]ETV84166.1 hypothetical protein, variant [Aphanomyces astaci]|eukprot:XP_009825858.1 hypothetical protein, variant [Aphanomyces astaci]